MDTSDLAKRMKDYEKRNRYYLQRRLPVIIRLDMRSGHSFTKGFKRPFDEIFMKSIQETAKFLCENIQNVKMSYQESDEISLVLVDYEKLNTDSWFDYRVDKLCSIAASMATLAFNKYFTSNAEYYIDCWYEDEGESTDEDSDYIDALRKSIKVGAMFDARVFNIPREEACNCIYWRQLDASRNSIQMVGQANFSHRELQNKSCNDIQDMLMTQRGINWNDLPTYQKRGSCVIKASYVENNIMKFGWVIDKDIPIFKGEGREYIERLINVGEE